MRQSVWTASLKVPEYPRLEEEHRAQVCVVGAGIAGLSTAYLLAREGKDVVVVEDGAIGSGMTQQTTAHLSCVLDRRYCELVHRHGEDGARLAADSHSAAIDRIEKISREENIDCDFQRLNGYLFLGEGDEEKNLDLELEAAHRAGLSQVRKLEQVPQLRAPRPCLEFPNQGQFHPLKYLSGLARAFERAGGKIFTHTHVDRIQSDRPARVIVGNHAITADSVVVATNSPINDLLAIHTKQAPYMTYVIGARVPRGALRKALFWDTEDPFHYVRLHDFPELSPGYEILIVGGEDHKSGQEKSNDQHARLETWARQRFPMMEQVDFAWAGQVMESMDGLAYLGRNPADRDNIYVITGDSGLGMTHGTLGGMVITDLIMGRENPWASLYDPSRKTLRAAGPFTKEALNMVAQYFDWITAGEVDSVENIPAGEGAVLRRGLKKLAVFRDASGQVHELSAVCPHLGCIVQWNSAEKTWDCPCHGSRFSKTGEVINGPANRALAAVNPSTAPVPA